MSSGSLVVIGGGVRSGKSAFAVRLALHRHRRRAFVATAQAFDDEMSARIEHHRRERGDAFHTIEAPIELGAALDELGDRYDVVVVDCLTVWLSNLLLANEASAAVLARVDAIVRAPRSHQLILVTNEVGMGVVPVSALGRLFRDLSGTANQRVSRRADELYLAALGTMLRLRPSPLEVVPTGDLHDS